MENKIIGYLFGTRNYEYTDGNSENTSEFPFRFLFTKEEAEAILKVALERKEVDESPYIAPIYGDGTIGRRVFRL